MQELTQSIADARARRDYQAIIDFVPYAKMIGIEVDRVEDDQLLLRLPYKRENIGNFRLPALHGGVIGAFMEHCAIVQTLWSLDSGRFPKIVDFSIDYLRPGRPETAYAACEVLRQGQRVANVSVKTWQSDPARPIATARGHFLLSNATESIASSTEEV